MSGHGRRPQPPSSNGGMPERTPSTPGHTSSLAALAAEAAKAPPSVLTSSPVHGNSFSSLPYRPGLPPQPSTEAGLQYGRGTSLQSGGGAGPQGVSGANFQPSSGIDPQYDRHPAFQVGRGIGLQSGGGITPQTGRGAGAQSMGAPSLRPSQTVSPQRQIDVFRHCLLMDIFDADSAIRRGQKFIELSNSDSLRAGGTHLVEEVRRRGMFLISTGQDRSRQFQEQFQSSYNPALRDALVLGQQRIPYASEISQIFQQEADPTKRIHIFRARLERFRTSPELSTDLAGIICQYRLAIDEDMKEAASAAHAETANAASNPIPGLHVQSGSASQASGSAHAGPSNPSRKRTGPDRAPEVSAPRLDPSWAGATSDAARLGAARATPTQAATTAEMVGTTSPSGSTTKRKSKSPRCAPPAE